MRRDRHGRISRSDERTNHLAPREESRLLLRLQGEQVAERIAEPRSERRGVDAIEYLDVDRPRPEESSEHEEWHRDARARGHDRSRAVPAEHPPGEDPVPNQIANVPRSGVVRGYDSFALEKRTSVIRVERDPYATEAFPPWLQVVELREVAARGAHEDDGGRAAVCVVHHFPRRDLAGLAV